MKVKGHTIFFQEKVPVDVKSCWSTGKGWSLGVRLPFFKSKQGIFCVGKIYILFILVIQHCICEIYLDLDLNLFLSSSLCKITQLQESEIRMTCWIFLNKKKQCNKLLWFLKKKKLVHVWLAIKMSQLDQKCWLLNYAFLMKFEEKKKL